MFYKMRVLSQGKYDDRGYSNEDSISYLQLQKPAEINGFITYNYGMDDDRFPLTFMTEGQGQAGTVDYPRYRRGGVYGDRAGAAVPGAGPRAGAFAAGFCPPLRRGRTRAQH